ncbi:hypothetical protein [Portibacter marinus]|nr:hypothetical protein [Portibacter marinus]
MKYILLIGIIYIVYRFYQLKDQAKREYNFPPKREKEEIEEFTDYEELE